MKIPNFFCLVTRCSCHSDHSRNPNVGDGAGQSAENWGSGEDAAPGGGGGGRARSLYATPPSPPPPRGREVVRQARLELSGGSTPDQLKPGF